MLEVVQHQQQVPVAQHLSQALQDRSRAGVEHAKGLVLFDTGCAPEVATDPEGYWGPAAKFLRNIRYRKDQVVDQQIKLHGYQPADVKYVVVSHLHLDHSGGMKLFPNAQFLVMKGELPYAYWPDRRARNGFILNDLLPTRGFDWKELEGDTDLFGDGTLMMLKTAGHTPGECSLKVRLKDFSIVLTGDTVHIRPQMRARRDGQRLRPGGSECINQAPGRDRVQRRSEIVDQPRAGGLSQIRARDGIAVGVLEKHK
jgi:glyoxylase-like metal-dependent hydrolase (beta-lactamase superfamily II)